uniref:Uncharacterized protein n=1 Tax=Rhizophora mucronata TaxID=61149 RepID=A0A2P2J1W1_RHIMU
MFPRRKKKKKRNSF